MHIKELFKMICGVSEDSVLATIVSETGSSPRSAGAHILIIGAGEVRGSIGGGPVEYAAIQYARGLLRQGRSARKTYRLYPNSGEELGMLCGGDVDVFFHFIRRDDTESLSFFKNCLARLEGCAENLWLFIDITDISAPKLAMYGPSAPSAGMDLCGESLNALTKCKPVLLETSGRCVYGELINAAGVVFIFGAGHVAQAVEPVLSRVGFRCAVLDNRREFLKPEAFSNTAELKLVDYGNIAETVAVTADDYLLIMTHNADLAVLRQVISQSWAYLGVIGSKTKIAAVKDLLRKEGVSEEPLNAINAPIGLRIRSETPEEIAVSIAAELILRRAERRNLF
ncbi:MAG: XdhC family protein [Spirochaetaceae bacterium]|jgi:xanthine dehydrogenase accessory factor|nr:XdhC family protein [Spirochaetaceae bacterium]